MSITQCAIIGAGPYGLSIAAHLKAAGLDFRIFGPPMHDWQTAMPDGMMLKSEGFASSMADADGIHTLEHYCRDEGLAYRPTGLPVARNLFVAYGQAFQRRCVPSLDPRTVSTLDRDAQGFRLTLEDGAVVLARRVVIATGVRPFAHVPEPLAQMSRTHLSHSADCASGRDLPMGHIVVVGGGSSAVDVAALARRCGRAVTIVARRDAVRFQAPLGPRSLLARFRAPMTMLGPGWRQALCVHAPLLFHAMPSRLRVSIVSRFLGPAPGWAVREQIEGHVPIRTGTRVDAIDMDEGRLRLTLVDRSGGRSMLHADHVVAATGYKVDIRRIAFLSERLRADVQTHDGAPVLSRRFESSTPGLFFVGPAAAQSFGPMLRFACGTGFAARCLTRYLAALDRRRRVGSLSAEQDAFA